MEIHIGSSSYISQFLSKKNNSIVKISSKKEKNSIKTDYKNLSFLKKIIINQKIDYVIIFLGKNFKGKSKKKSFYINYELPLKVLNYLTKVNKSKLKIIFFGTYLEDEYRTSKNNLDYKRDKINLRNQVKLLSKKSKFEFVWLKLPLVYGKDQFNKNFTSILIKNINMNNTINIQNKFNTLYLLNIYDVCRLIFLIKKKWHIYKNKVIAPKAEGPFFIYELINMITKKTKMNFDVVYKNLKRKKKIRIKKNLINYKIKNNFINFLLKNV